MRPQGLITIAAFVLTTSIADKGHIKQVLLKKCNGRDYSLTCFKLDLLRLLTQVGNSTRFYLAPGITLVGTDETTQFADKLDNVIEKPKTKEQFDEFLIDAATNYLGTMNLTLQLRDSRVLNQIRSLSGNVWTGVAGLFSGRGKKGWYLVGITAAVGVGLLSALTGSALVASIIALVMSGAQMLRGGGAGGFGAPPSRVTQYEIISRPGYATAPAAHYYDHEHHHSAAYTAPYAAPYAYTRRQEQIEDDKIDLPIQ